MYISGTPPSLVETKMERRRVHAWWSSIGAQRSQLASLMNEFFASRYSFFSCSASTWWTSRGIPNHLKIRESNSRAAKSTFEMVQHRKIPAKSFIITANATHSRRLAAIINGHSWILKIDTALSHKHISVPGLRLVCKLKHAHTQ